MITYKVFGQAFTNEKTFWKLCQAWDLEDAYRRGRKLMAEFGYRLTDVRELPQ